MRKPKQKANPLRRDLQEEDRAEARHWYDQQHDVNDNPVQMRVNLSNRLWRGVKAKGTAGGDCGKCGREDVTMYGDRCKPCTLTEIRAAVLAEKVIPFMEKYGL